MDTRQKFEDCIKACNDCAVECESCATACLQEDDVKMLARCIALDRDCARICYTASAFMAGESEFAQDICRLCAGHTISSSSSVTTTPFEHRRPSASLTASSVMSTALLSPIPAADHLNLEEGLPVRIEDTYPIAFRGREVQGLIRQEHAEDGTDTGVPLSLARRLGMRRS